MLKEFKKSITTLKVRNFKKYINEVVGSELTVK